MTTLAAPQTRARILVAALLAAVLVVFGSTPVHAAQTETASVLFTDTTTVRGTPLKTFYSGTWGKNSTHTWGNAGAAFEVAFTGETVALFGRRDTTNGTADVYVDDVKIGSANYQGSKSSTTVEIARFTGLTPGAHVLRVVTVGWINHARVDVTTTVQIDERALLAASIDRYSEADAAAYTASSWAPFAAALSAATAARDNASATGAALTSARTALEAAASARVQVSGLREVLDQYRTRVPSNYTAESWATFAAAITAGDAVAADANATAAAVGAAKTTVQNAAAALVVLSEGTAGSIENSRFWLDTEGNPIFSQGGGIFRFGDTYYWYGVQYTASQYYYDNPNRIYNRAGDVDFVAVTAYSSTDLVNWTFENNVATRDTKVNIPTSKNKAGTTYFSDMKTLADSVWIGRLGVAYNENTGKYVLLTQFENADPNRVDNAGVLFLTGDSPTADFEYGNLQTVLPGVLDNGSGWNKGTGDQTVFTDDDGQDYLVFSYRNGRSRTYVAKISNTDSLTVETATQIFAGAGREGNAMFKLDGQYYVASSDLHGWNTSQTYVVRSLNGQIQGAYSSMYVLPGTEKDYSHVTQSGFFVTVKGTEQDTVIYAGDRWANFAWNGLGYNQWVPLSGTGADVSFNSLSHWTLNATTGTWAVGQDNNYILNPDFAADRIAVTSVTGWTQTTDASSSTSAFVSNPGPGADASRFALRLGSASAFAGDVHQDNEVPAGIYTLALKANYAGGLSAAQVVVTGADGVDHVLDIPAASGWASASLEGIPLPAGTARVAIRAEGTGGQSLTVDSLSLRRQAIDDSALRTLVEQASGLDAAAYSAASWAPLVAARDAGAAVLGALSTQAQIDAASAALTSARDALASALRSVTVAPGALLVAVGTTYDPASVVVTGTFADGTTRALTAAEYAVSGFDTATAGMRTVSVRADAALAATGAASPAASLSLEVLRAWTAAQTYNTGDAVIQGGTRWVASWWTQNQKPGDVNGPWQQQITAPDGTAVWTASRVFVAGDTVVLNDVRYTAKWWTRGQAPGDPNGPWKRIN